MNSNKSKNVLVLVICATVLTGYFLFQGVQQNGEAKSTLLVTQIGSPYEKNLTTVISTKNKNGKVKIHAELPQANVRDIKLSPDGQHIAYTFIEFLSSAKGPEVMQKIVTIRIADGNTTEISGINADLKKIALINYYKILGWSSDNSLLYVLKVNDWQAGWQDKGLYAINLATRQVTTVNLSNEILGNAVLSPDGTKIAYVPYESASKPGSDGPWIPFKPQTIKILDIILGNATTLTSVSKEISHYYGLKWSESDEIAYTLNDGKVVTERFK